jgi:hypothetical protein
VSWTEKPAFAHWLAIEFVVSFQDSGLSHGVTQCRSGQYAQRVAC